MLTKLFNVWTHNCRSNYESRSCCRRNLRSSLRSSLAEAISWPFLLEWDSDTAGDIKALKLHLLCWSCTRTFVFLKLLTFDDEERVLDLFEKAESDPSKRTSLPLSPMWLRLMWLRYELAHPSNGLKSNKVKKEKFFWLIEWIENPLPWPGKGILMLSKLE